MNRQSTLLLILLVIVVMTRTNLVKGREAELNYDVTTSINSVTRDDVEDNDVFMGEDQLDRDANTTLDSEGRRDSNQDNTQENAEIISGSSGKINQRENVSKDKIEITENDDDDDNKNMKHTFKYENDHSSKKLGIDNTRYYSDAVSDVTEREEDPYEDSDDDTDIHVAAIKQTWIRVTWASDIENHTTIAPALRKPYVRRNETENLVFHDPSIHRKVLALSAVAAVGLAIGFFIYFHNLSVEFEAISDFYKGYMGRRMLIAEGRLSSRQYLERLKKGLIHIDLDGNQQENNELNKNKARRKMTCPSADRMLQLCTSRGNTSSTERLAKNSSNETSSQGHPTGHATEDADQTEYTLGVQVKAFASVTITPLADHIKKHKRHHRQQDFGQAQFIGQHYRDVLQWKPEHKSKHRHKRRKTQRPPEPPFNRAEDLDQLQDLQCLLYREQKQLQQEEQPKKQQWRFADDSTSDIDQSLMSEDLISFHQRHIRDDPLLAHSERPHHLHRNPLVKQSNMRRNAQFEPGHLKRSSFSSNQHEWPESAPVHHRRDSISDSMSRASVNAQSRSLRDYCQESNSLSIEAHQDPSDVPNSFPLSKKNHMRLELTQVSSHASHSLQNCSEEPILSASNASNKPDDQEPRSLHNRASVERNKCKSPPSFQESPYSTKPSIIDSPFLKHSLQDRQSQSELSYSFRHNPSSILNPSRNLSSAPPHPASASSLLSTSTCSIPSLLSSSSSSSCASPSLSVCLQQHLPLYVSFYIEDDDPEWRQLDYSLEVGEPPKTFAEFVRQYDLGIFRFDKEITGRDLELRKNLYAQFQLWKFRRQRRFRIVVTERAKKDMAGQDGSFGGRR